MKRRRKYKPTNDGRCPHSLWPLQRRFSSCHQMPTQPHHPPKSWTDLVGFLHGRYSCPLLITVFSKQGDGAMICRAIDDNLLVGGRPHSGQQDWTRHVQSLINQPPTAGYWLEPIPMRLSWQILGHCKLERSTVGSAAFLPIRLK